MSAPQNFHAATFVLYCLHAVWIATAAPFSLIIFFWRHEIGLGVLYCQLLCLSLAAHTPDNSFMGFVAEELNETERLNIQRNKVNNMAVVYGKEASMWKVGIT